MPERGKHNNGLFALKIISFFVLTVLCSFMLGCGYYTYDKIDGYDDFLKNYERYDRRTDSTLPENPIIPEPDSESRIPDINGFTPITEKQFDFGLPFNSDVTFVKSGEENYALTNDGTLTSITEDLSQEKLLYGKYISQINGKSGVKDIYGKTIVPAKYDEIDIIENTILAKAGSVYEVYLNGKPISMSDIVQDVTLINCDYLLVDGKICGTDFQEMTICGYPYIDIPSEGIVMVKLDGGYYGYINVETQEQIGDKYLQASRFSEGAAIVTDETENISIIDIFGQILYSTRDRLIGEKSNGYHCYLKYNMYGVMNDKFEDLTAPIFEFVKYEKAVSDYLIIRAENGERLYSLKSNEYQTEIYEEIIYSDGFFICRNGQESMLLDDKLEQIVSCESISINNDILMIVYNGKYLYYARNK